MCSNFTGLLPVLRNVHGCLWLYITYWKCNYIANKMKVITFMSSCVQSESKRPKHRTAKVPATARLTQPLQCWLLPLLTNCIHVATVLVAVGWIHSLSGHSHQCSAAPQEIWSQATLRIEACFLKFCEHLKKKLSPPWPLGRSAQSEK